MTGQVLRRKVRVVQRGPAEGGSVPERAWRVAFARALRDEVGLQAEFASLSIARMSLAEVLDLPPERALILTLEGPELGMGLLILSAEVMSGMVEMMTLGRCTSQPVEARKPTRTDAAMVAPVAERALRNLEAALEAEGDLVWTSDFHFASSLEDARPLALLLEDIPYRVIRGRLSLADGVREGGLILVLPAEGRGRKPDVAPDLTPEALAAPIFAAKLAAQVEQAQVRFDAVLTRLTLPISEAMALTPDMVLALPSAALDRISLEGLDGRKLGEGKLGQQRGLRAVRLTLPATGHWADTGRSRPMTTDPLPEDRETPPPLAATGT